MQQLHLGIPRQTIHKVLPNRKKTRTLNCFSNTETGQQNDTLKGLIVIHLNIPSTEVLKSQIIANAKEMYPFFQNHFSYFSQGNGQ